MDLDALRTIFSTLPVAIVAAALFATAVTVDTLRAGASRAIAFSLALLLGTQLFGTLSQTAFLSSVFNAGTSPRTALVAYIVLVFLLAFLFYRMNSSLHGDASRPMLALLTGLFTTIVVLVAWHMPNPLSQLWQFSPLIESMFGQAYRIYWILAAFIAFTFVRG
jgi:hypothetical protein